MELLERARREFAEKIRAMSALRSTRLVDALGSVPREEFLGPGPWQILRLAEAVHGYESTPDDDPRHLYDNVLVALDASRTSTTASQHSCRDASTISTCLLAIGSFTSAAVWGITRQLRR